MIGIDVLVLIKYLGQLLFMYSAMNLIFSTNFVTYGKFCESLIDGHVWLTLIVNIYYIEI